MNKLNLNYPEGAFTDPNAPWNLVTCPECEFDMETGFIDDCGVCYDCLEKEGAEI